MADSFGVRKGAWTEEEDDLLRKCIQKYGEAKWHQVPLRAGKQFQHYFQVVFTGAASIYAISTVYILSFKQFQDCIDAGKAVDCGG